MWPVGFMTWRIGDLLDPGEQFAWVADHGFEAVGFHASPGDPPHWRGVDPGGCPAPERARLRRLLDAFERKEVHAPFRLTLGPDAPEQTVDELLPVLDLAGDLGCDVVTVHLRLPPDGALAAQRDAAARLGTEALRRGLVIGLETEWGFDAIRTWGADGVGVTLDIGHLHLDAPRYLDPFGSLEAVVRHLGDLLVHLHVHDVDDLSDHVEPGTGRVDFDSLLRGLQATGYQGMLMLELNPDRVTPEAIARSRVTLLACGR
ncbi:MAG: sugar phosphate isomerase/epimerase [Armatimonadetes bacterium]|nr:sugar phosphate isomerase/epimerase [Armatimonadota bacterium]